jgi:hypothetical protein
LEKLRDAAAAVGFRFLEQFLAMREAAECRLNTFEERNVWLQELAAAVDREAGFPGKPGAETDRPCD